MRTFFALILSVLLLAFISSTNAVRISTRSASTLTGSSCRESCEKKYLKSKEYVKAQQCKNVCAAFGK